MPVSLSLPKDIINMWICCFLREILSPYIPTQYSVIGKWLFLFGLVWFSCFVVLGVEVEMGLMEVGDRNRRSRIPEANWLARRSHCQLSVFMCTHMQMCILHMHMCKRFLQYNLYDVKYADDK